MRSSQQGASSSSTSCQDCGNKAKRDCAHMRCRTCCKSRGFHCPTHVKSTWVPVAHRRHRHHHLLLSSSSTPADYHFHPLSIRAHSHSPSGMEAGNFPAEVNSMATFRCVRVSSDDNVVDQYAYQTTVNIGGHVFRGILYDQGPVAIATVAPGESSSSDHQYSHHHPPPSGATMSATTATAPSSGTNLIYPPHGLYSAAPFNAFFPGMQFFPHPRP